MSDYNSSIRLTIPKELTKDHYVEPSGLSREEAKKICKKYGVIWGCD